MWTNMWSKTNSSCNIFSKISPVMYNKKSKNSSEIIRCFLNQKLGFLSWKISAKKYLKLLKNFTA